MTNAKIGDFKLFDFSGILILHILALAAPFTFTWSGFVLFLVMIVLTASLGVTMGFHRLLTHQSFTTPKFIKYILTYFGCLALQGGPIQWVGTHRFHHKEVDKAEDPHSPLQGFLWAHMLWNFYKHPKLTTMNQLKRYALDLYRDPVLRFFEKSFFMLYLGSAIIVFVIGLLVGGWKLGLSLVVWGFALRTVYVWHTTWLVNSATHLWGYKTYKTADNSRNNWWVALLTFGEGWHNNHHAYPTSAKTGYSWYEIDMTYWFIWFLAKMGLAKKVLQPQYAKIPR